MTDQEIALKAKEIRKLVVRMVHAAKCGHPGGPLGLADIYAVLYAEAMRYDTKKPAWEDRDRLILSNGHVGAVRYAAMALSGFFPVEEAMT
ncbi:MAG: transketolase, partial [Spirochaetia bacterium]|nr:transketolase [Spirochaetia bacterium]